MSPVLPDAPPTGLSPVAARLVRRIGFGPRADQIEMLTALDDHAVAEWLLSGLPPADPWGDGSFVVTAESSAAERRRAVHGALSQWISAIVTADSGADDWVTWFWHGHLVSAITDVKNPQFMVDQMRLFRTEGRGPFLGLLTAVTVDPAMLLYLNGNESTAAAPNENYSRELLELFTIGRGEYTEDDIAAGARALSGWRVVRGSSVASFIPRRHDDRPQRYLGVDGVHDLATVVEAIGAHPSLASAVARRLAHAIVGPRADDAVIAAGAAAFREADGSIDAVIAALVAALVDGADGGAIVTAPFPWMLAALRVTGATVDLASASAQLRAAGQLPWFPPNVSGWPSGVAWDNAATAVARFTIATAIASDTDARHPALAAGVDHLPAWLGIAGEWSPATRAALESVSDARQRLALALTSPEFVTV
jgi:uncharacterized protein (DUF1800 family)